MNFGGDMKRFVLIICFLCFIITLFSQTTIDSLEFQLESASEKDKTEILNELAKNNWDIQPRKSLEFASQALILSQKYKDKYQEIHSLNNMGTASAILGDIEKALEYFQQGLTIANEEDNKEMISGISNNLANIHFGWGSYRESLKFYILAAKMFSKLNNEHGLCVSYGNIALIYDYLTEYEKSLEYHKLALKYAEKIDDKREIASCYLNIAEHHSSLKKFDTAFEFYQKAYDIGKSLNSMMLITGSLNGIASYYKQEKKYRLAIENFLKSLQISVQSGDITQTAATYYEVGEIYFFLGKYNEALSNSLEGFRLSKELNYQRGIVRCSALLVEVYEKLDNLEKAYEYLNLYSTLKDSVNSEENKLIISEMQTKFETEKKEQEIELLTKEKQIQIIYRNLLFIGVILIIIFIAIIYNRYLLKVRANEQIKKREIELEKANATKNKFFSIIAHDLKNAFNSIRVGSKLLSVDIELLDKKTIKTIGFELRSSAENLYKLLENLLQWSRLQMGSIKLQIMKLNLKLITDQNIELLSGNAQKKNITIINEVSEDINVITDRNMLDSILQNLIANALKFSHKDSEITIAAEKKDDFIETKISDKGIGISENNIEKLFKIDQHFTVRGTESEKGTGLGLILCKEFIEKNNGEIRIASKLKEGTTVTFTLPAYFENSL